MVMPGNGVPMMQTHAGQGPIMVRQVAGGGMPMQQGVRGMPVPGSGMQVGSPRPGQPPVLPQSQQQQQQQQQQRLGMGVPFGTGMGVVNANVIVPDKQQMPQPEQKQHEETVASLQAWGSPAGKIQIGSQSGSPAFPGVGHSQGGPQGNEGSSLDDVGLGAWNAAGAGDLSVGSRDFLPRWGGNGSSNVTPEKAPAPGQNNAGTPLGDAFAGGAPNGAVGLGALGSIAMPDSADGFNEDDMNANFSSLLFDD
jgi:hypothetical protein